MSKDAQTFADAFDALADTTKEVANLRARAGLMDALSALVAAEG
jgi:predicted XRE-type DNA-binding protein